MTIQHASFLSLWLVLFLRGRFYVANFLVIGTLMIALRCEHNDDQWVTYFDSSQACLSADRAPLISICAVVLVLFIVMVTIHKLCIFDHKISPNNPFAQLNGVFNLSNHFCRTILMVFFVAIPNVSFSHSRFLYPFYHGYFSR